MNILMFLLALIAIGLVAYGIYLLVLWVMRKQSAEMAESHEIRENIRKVQIIDVRETPEFDAKHILGARSIPMSQFKQRFAEIRKDKPVYLYDDALNYASRAANILKKEGYDKIYILKGGFSSWTGKVKSEL
ncbi:rhodanese-like domain-containing protein [Ruoffia tabacinasalis]|uniref:rhodanese-like domain-containing protein n=1 Tax=Ruoffia tabacinasalis TaxID=87458 RepID=UPI003F9E7040